MADERIILQRQALRKLNSSLIHIEGWGAKLTTWQEVDEYLANCRETLAEVHNYRDKMRNDFLTLMMYMTLNNLSLQIGNIPLLDKINNVASGWYKPVVRSYTFEIATLETWQNSNKRLFK